MATLLSTTKEWYCPNCPQTAWTHEARPHTQYHTCAGLRYISAPFVQKGVAAKVEALDREDYVGAELVQTDGNGRPVMSVRTTRDEGIDVAVFAPTALAKGAAHGLV